MDRVTKPLMEAAFAADDLRLFLDTHPADAKARADYRAAADSVQCQKEQLSCPISAMDAGKGRTWDWTRTPWPWEKEG